MTDPAASEQIKQLIADQDATARRLLGVGEDVQLPPSAIRPLGDPASAPASRPDPPGQ